MVEFKNRVIIKKNVQLLNFWGEKSSKEREK